MKFNCSEVYNLTKLLQYFSHIFFASNFRPLLQISKLQKFLNRDSSNPQKLPLNHVLSRSIQNAAVRVSLTGIRTLLCERA